MPTFAKRTSNFAIAQTSALPPSWGPAAKRRLLLGASVLALAVPLTAAVAPRPAFAVICANAGAGANSGTDGAVGHQYGLRFGRQRQRQPQR